MKLTPVSASQVIEIVQEAMMDQGCTAARELCENDPDLTHDVMVRMDYEEFQNGNYKPYVIGDMDQCWVDIAANVIVTATLINWASGDVIL